MNNENSEQTDTLRLYRQYQQSRTHRVDDGATAASRVTDMTTEYDGEPERLYQLYRSTRTCDRDVAIEDILCRIKQDVTAPDRKAEKASVGKTQSWYRRLFSLPGDLLQKLAGSKSTVIRFGVPALAAVFLAVLVVPLVSQQPADSLAPDSLMRHAASIAQFVEKTESSSFGFTSSNANEKRAFANGVLSVDIDLLERGAKDAESREKLEVLKARLSAVQFDDDVSAQEWLKLGEVVESISLAAQYAIQSSDTLPLRDTLDTLKSTQPPTVDLAAGGIVTDLKSVRVTDEIDFKQARDILEKTRNIKILMQ